MTMYESYFQWQGRPFRSAPCAEDYVHTTSMQRAIDQCCAAIRRELGPASIIATAGMGKTLALSVIARRVQDALRPVHVFCNRDDARADLLQNVLFELGQPFRNMSIAELRLTLKAACCRRNDSTLGTLLLLDDADRLSVDVMEELRWISNLSHAGSPLVSIVMAGGMSLEETLNHPRLASLNQRISVRTYLSELNRDETRRYIHGQIERVGGDPATVISDQAIVAVHQLSQGCPRIINQICDQAMLLAASADKLPIDETMVHQAWADIQCLPIDVPQDVLEASGSQSPASPSDSGGLNREPTAVTMETPDPATKGAASSDEESWEVIEFGTLDDMDPQIQPPGQPDTIPAPAESVNKAPTDENFQLAEPSDALSASLTGAEQFSEQVSEGTEPFSESAHRSQPVVHESEAWSVVTPFVDGAVDASEEYRLAPLDDDTPTPLSGPLDDSFDVEVSIRDHFCTVVAETNLNALRVGDEHVDSLNSQLRAKLKTGLMVESQSELPKVVCESRMEASRRVDSESGSLQIAPESVFEENDSGDSLEAFAGHEDLRLTPEEIAQLESVDKFLNDVEARIRRELRNGPSMDPDIENGSADTVAESTEALDVVSDDSFDHAGHRATIPSETRLVADADLGNAEDDRDLLVVSHVHHPPTGKSPNGPTNRSTTETRRDGETENPNPQGRAIRMDYQKLFRQLKQQSST